MNIANLEKTKKSKIVIILLMIYLSGVIIYYILGDFDKCIGFVPDERYYLQAAKAFSAGKGMYYNGIKSTFQKVFYPILISPAFKVKNLHTQINLVCLIGIMFDMTSIFPIYLICRKLEFNRVKSLCGCILSLSFPIFLYSASFMSETAFVPLWIWLIYLIMFMLDSEDVIILIPVLVGVLGYALYLCKEVGIVAIPALCLTKIIFTLKKKGHFKGLISCLISAVVFLSLYVLARICYFGSASGSYSYDLRVPKAPENVDKNPISYFFYAVLFYIGYTVLVNNIFPVFIRTKKDDLNHKLSLFIEMTIVILIVVVVYKISLTEDFGRLSPRLHFRYFEPLFIPYIICFIARLDDIDNETIFINKYIKISFIFYLLVLLLLPGLDINELLDSTTTTVYMLPTKIAYLYFWGNSRKMVIMTFVEKVIVLTVVLLEMRMIKKNKTHFVIVFISLVFVINVVGIGLKYFDIKNNYELSPSFVLEMQSINDELENLDGNKLFVTLRTGRLSEIVVTYYDLKNADVFFADDEYNTSDKTITLKAGGGVSRNVDISDYDFIVYENSVWEDDERDSIPPEKIVLSTEHFFIVEN